MCENKGQTHMSYYIGIGGQMRSGKDTVADYLAPKIGYERASFASNVKRIYCETFGVDIEFVEKWKVIPENPPGFDSTVRQGLQLIGDGFRKIKGDIWVELALRDKNRKAVISDCRYINELKAVKDSGGYNILMCRPGYENNDPNGSEAQIRPLADYFASTKQEGVVKAGLDAPYGCEFVDFFIINNGTVEDLFAKSDQFGRFLRECHQVGGIIPTAGG